MKYLSTSQNGFKVYYDSKDSHAATHLTDTPELIGLVNEIIPQLQLIGDYIEYEHDFAREIGFTDLVLNNPGDKIVYAKRRNRAAYNPFNMSQKPQPCNYVSLALRKTGSTAYELLSAYVGREGTPPFPGEETAAESISFWNNHSLVFGTQEIQEDTLTDTCPWQAVPTELASHPSARIVFSKSKCKLVAI